MNIAHIFTTPIAVFDDFSSQRDLIATIANKACSEAQEGPEWDCNITTTFAASSRFHEDKRLAVFVEEVEQAGQDYSNHIWGRASRIKHSWANRAESYQYQEYHDHRGSNTKFCAVFYAQIEDKETIIFHSPFQNIIEINQNSIVQIVARENRLVIFPAYLAHSFQGKKRIIPKISIAFNFVLI